MSGRFGIVVVLLAVCVPAEVLSAPQDGLADYTVANWTTWAGLPSNLVRGMAQGHDGALWLATAGGLARFDGVTFSPVETLGTGQVTAVAVGRKGVVWAASGASREVVELSETGIRRLAPPDAQMRSAVEWLVEDRVERLWAGTEVGLFHLEGREWRRAGTEDGLGELPVRSVRARDGVLWVAAGDGLYRQVADSVRFERIDAVAGESLEDIAAARDGTVAWSHRGHGFQLLSSSMRSGRALPNLGRGTRVLYDSAAHLWVGTTGDGLWRVTTNPDGSLTTARLPILGVRSLFEDRDGNLWAGTVEGLFRISPRRITAVLAFGSVTSVASTARRVWIGTTTGLLYTPDRQVPPVRVDDPVVRGFREMHSDHTGVLWVLADRLSSFVNGRWIPAHLPREIALPDVTSFLPDRRGWLWFAMRDGRVLSWRPDDPRAEVVATGLLGGRIALLAADLAGRLWLSLDAGRLGMVSSDRTVRMFDPNELLPGPYNDVYQDSRGEIWVVGSQGVARFVDGRFRRVESLGVTLTSAIVEDSEGDLWLGTGDGLDHVRRSDLVVASMSGAYKVRPALFDASDGLPGLTGRFGHPNAARAYDGSLWFVTGRGVAVVDPSALKLRKPPASLRVQRLYEDDVQAVGLPATIGPATSRMRIEFGAVDLLTPHKVRYRYQLDGFDAAWIDAGSRREAVYANLPAGRYHFRVVASNGAGPEAEVQTAWEFTVTPSFYRTWWFGPLAVVAILTGLAVAWRARLMRQRREFSLLLAERIRLSRDLHDTLLQSLAGIALQFEAAIESLDATSPIRQRLVSLRGRIEDYIREARRSILNLRATPTDYSDLPTLLKRLVDSVSSDTMALVTFSEEGRAYHLTSFVDEQIMRIATEAVTNAIRHANATHIDVELLWSESSVRLVVRDDGVGFEPEAHAHSGHLGLLGMTERAGQIGGLLTVDSAPGLGTRVVLVASIRRSMKDVA